jgi:hypothetical protein
MNHEGDGIFAIKATCGLRAYGWHAQHQGKRAFIISHVIMKDRRKLDTADRERARAARAQFDRQRRPTAKQVKSV